MGGGSRADSADVGGKNWEDDDGQDDEKVGRVSAPPDPLACTRQCGCRAGCVRGVAEEWHPSHGRARMSANQGGRKTGAVATSGLDEEIPLPHRVRRGHDPGMNRFQTFVLLVAGLPGFTRAGEVAFNGRTFQVAEGYTMTEAAGRAVVERPIEACFDGKGRLLVTESSGSNDPVAKQVKDKTHRVLRLSDTDGDGVFETRTVFADGLMFPEGILWHDGAVYVAAVPEIWKFTDADDDGVAEKREVWFDGKTMTGCANDLHGPYIGPDGMIYWCKGAFAEQTYDFPGKPGWKSRASHVFRMRPDKTGMECVFTAGMDNPVGLAWTPEGDLMVCGTFLQHPEAGRRDGIIHAVRGGVWGKDHDVLDGHVRTGGLMPVMTHLGPAAPAGMCRYGRDLLVCQFNLRTVSRHQLIPDGATYRTEDSALLTTEHPDFHPTDVLQAPDGSVVVIDTGGWYKLCCPTSQLAKPEVPGAIYRLRKAGGEVPVACPEPRWKGEAEPGAALKSQNAHIRRAGVEAAGRGGNTIPVKTLLGALPEGKPDRFLDHAVTYALVEGGDPAAMAGAVPEAGPTGQRSLIYALAQTKPEAVQSSAVAGLLATDDAGLLEALVFGFSKVPAWKAAGMEWLGAHLAGQRPSVAAALIEKLGAADASMLPDLGGLLEKSEDPGLRVKVVAAMRSLAKKGEWPEGWAGPLLKALRSGAKDEAREAAGFFARGKLDARPGVAQALAEFAGDASRPAELRVAVLANPALGAVAGGNLALLVSRLSAETAVEARLAAAQVIGSLALKPERLRELAPVVARAGMLERPLLLKAFRSCADEAVGMQLLDGLESGGGLSAVPEQALQEALAAFPDSVKARAKAARAKAAPDREAQERHLAELEKSLPAGDVTRGSVVFHSAKTSCLLCHKIGYKGGTLGPDLTRVGAVRTRRDLLEGVLYPSASFVRSYEPVEVADRAGARTLGVIRNQNAESLTLGTGALTLEVKIPIADVASISPGQTSLMPGAFEQLLKPEEIADLISYLQSLK